MLKKIILFLSLIIILIILNSSLEETEPVYYEESNNSEYRQIYLLFENNILNTDNFEEYLKEMEIIKIYPYINPIYAPRIKANYSYSFTHTIHQYDLVKFKESYIEKLRSIGLINEANECQIKGVVIKKVLVYSSLEEINEIIKNENIKYSIKLNGIYQ